MKLRWKVNKYDDKKHFRRTAVNTKAINVQVKPMRGGIRL